MELNSKHKFPLCFLHAIYAEPKGNVTGYFACALSHVPWTEACHQRSGVEFSTCGVLLVLKKFRILQDFRFLEKG